MLSEINQELSIYIPHVYMNITEERVIKVFEMLEIGIVKRVDFVEKDTPDKNISKKAFIHFEKWFESEMVKNFQKRIVDPNERATIVYDEPWYWMVFPNKNPITEKEAMFQEFMSDASKRIEKLENLVEFMAAKLMITDSDQQDEVIEKSDSNSVNDLMSILMSNDKSDNVMPITNNVSFGDWKNPNVTNYDPINKGCEV